MARSVAQTLTLTRTLARQGRRVSSSSTQSLSPLSRLLPHRAQSNQSSASSDLTDLESNADPLIRKLEDAIHRIIVRRSAPDWLPFLPGASYWVPPPRSASNGLAQLLHKLANPITDEESMSVTNLRGWPSPSYFVQGAAPHPGEVETTPNCNSQSEDEEG